MTEQQAHIVKQYTQQMRHFEFGSIEKKENEYEVQASYDGPRMVYKENTGRIHRLSPGLLKIDSMDEWNVIFMIVKDGVSAEFLI